MTALYLTVLGASLLGSVHCAGMCGGFVAFYAGGATRDRRPSPLVHLAYNAGRLVAYAALGAVAGGLGAAIDATGGMLLGIQRVAALVSGTLIAVWGVLALLEARGVRVPRVSPPGALGAVASAAIRRLAAASARTRALVIGLLTGALPCGWLYGFVIAATGTGSALAGVLLMTVFWSGTLPIMLGLGFGVQAVTGPLRRYLPTACALAMIAVGVLAVTGRMRTAPEIHAHGERRAAPSSTLAPAPQHQHGHR